MVFNKAKMFISPEDEFSQNDELKQIDFASNSVGNHLLLLIYIYIVNPINIIHGSMN